MKPVATRSIRRIGERIYIQKATIVINDPCHNYWAEVEPIFEKIIEEKISVLRILIDKTTYSSQLNSNSRRMRSLWITALKKNPGTLDYILGMPHIVFEQMCGDDKYKIYECTLDATSNN